jgi:ubiquinone/menaquinone biosynthesis C-methylase UbiE
MKKLDSEKRLRKFVFDISWSHIRYAKEYAKTIGQGIEFFTTNLFEIPFTGHSIDIVGTSHSLEPNGEQEKEALRELYQVIARYLVLWQPDYNRISSKFTDPQPAWDIYLSQIV